jgi:hypothetical protein
MTMSEREISRISFPTSLPEGSAAAHVALGSRIEGEPGWSIQTLNMGPLRSSPGYRQYLQDTVGSSYDWSDELRFDKRTGCLVGFILKTPESGSIKPEIAKSWLDLSPRVGVPVLEDRENGFQIDPLDLRFLAGDGSALVVGDARLPATNAESLRLAIGSDIDLLFQRGSYAGWILRTPLAHLVAEPGDRIPGFDEPRLHDMLSEYLALVVEPNIARMSDEDPEMRGALQALRTRIQAVDAVQARALETAVERVLEVFYAG